MQTVATRDFSRRVTRITILSYSAIAVIILIVASFLPEKPFGSVLFGIAAGALLAATSVLTLSKMVASPEGGLAWVVVDYLVKIALIAGVLLVAKFWSALDPVLVAVPVIAAVLLTVVVQLTAIMQRDRETKTLK